MSKILNDFSDANSKIGRMEIAVTIANAISQKIGKKVDATAVQKNNGKTQIGLSIHFHTKQICPIIYLDEYLQMIENQLITIEEVTAEINDVLEKSIQDMENDMPNFIFNKEYILENTYYSVVNKEKNQCLLNDCPYQEKLDLVVLFRCCIKKDNNEVSSFLIHNRHIKSLGINLNELAEAARKNTYQLFGCDIKSLSDFLNDMGIKVDVSPSESDFIIITNKQKIEGASLIMYSEIFEELSQKLSTDLYILPSSIHELLLLKVSNENMQVEQLKDLVQQINRSIVSEEDFLSDSIYQYNREYGFILR